MSDVLVFVGPIDNVIVNGCFSKNSQTVKPYSKHTTEKQFFKYLIIAHSYVKGL